VIVARRIRPGWRTGGGTAAGQPADAQAPLAEDAIPVPVSLSVLPTQGPSSAAASSSGPAGVPAI